MFSNPCSLRSAHCAALIALAAAAGIVRAPATQASGSSGSMSAARECAPSAEMPRKFTPVVFDPHHLAPWLGAGAASIDAPMRTVDLGGEAIVMPESILSMPRRHENRNVFSISMLVPRAPQHRLPFAVGPPPTRASATGCAFRLF